MDLITAAVLSSCHVERIPRTSCRMRLERSIIEAPSIRQIIELLGGNSAETL